jgi:cytidyltransferase-like protein
MTIGSVEMGIKQEEIVDDPGAKDVLLEDVDFAITDAQRGEIQKLVADFGNKYREEFGTSKKQQLALVVGRFQPPHLGHLVKLLMAAEIADVVAVGVGSADEDVHDKRGSERDVNNPFSVVDREYLLKHHLKKFFPDEEEIARRFKFIPLEDYYHRKNLTEPSDIVWGRETNNKVLAAVKDLGIQKIGTVLSDKEEWVTRCFAGRVRPIVHPLFDELNQTGTNLRTKMRQPRSDGRDPILAPNGPHAIKWPK